MNFSKLETKSNKTWNINSDLHKIPFYDTSKFEFVKILEDNTDVILKELSDLTQKDFLKWPETICETGWVYFCFFYL